MARVSVIKTSIIRDAAKVACGVKFEGDGKTREILLTDLNPTLMAESACHGVKQKVGDAAAKDAGTTAAVKWAALTRVADQITGPDGVWSARGEGDNGILIEAIARVTEQSVEMATEAFDAWDEETQSQMRKDPTVIKAMGEIRAELAAKRTAAAPDSVKAASDALAKLKAMKAPTDKAKKAPAEKKVA